MTTPFMDLELRILRSDGSAVRVYVNDTNWRIVVKDDRGLREAPVSLDPPYPSGFLYPSEMSFIDKLVHTMRQQSRNSKPSERGGPDPRPQIPHGERHDKSHGLKVNSDGDPYFETNGD